jgi:ribonuclease D
MLDHLATQPIVAVDTESDSLFSYYPKVCLLQITTFAAGQPADSEAVVDYLVDPLRLTHLDALGPLFADPQREVVIHAAENDILLLQREFNFNFANIFDTQLAARILGWERAGLAAILEEQFGVVSDKRMQRTNWGRRPLLPEQIVYAQMDTHYLLALRRRLVAELHTRDRWEEAQEAFAELAQLDYRNRPANERNVWQMKEARDVPLAQTGVLEALWLWREAEAQRQDRPPFKIVNNRVLVELAHHQPDRRARLTAVPGLDPREVERYGAAILQTIAEGKQRPLPPLPEVVARPELWLDKSVLRRYDDLRRWRGDAAAARGVAPDIVLTNDVLMEIAKAQPATLDELREVARIGPWKAKTYGPALLKLAAN